MSVWLEGRGGHINFGFIGWTKVVTLIGLGGGPVDLLTTDGNPLVISDADALKIAAALDAILDDIPNERVAPDLVESVSAAGVVCSRPSLEASALTYWSGSSYKGYLTAFADFCRAGSFSFYPPPPEFVQSWIDEAL
jgi:hypothetical protein